jgi:signal transduction histidine kinase
MSKTIIETNMGGKLIVEDIENGTKFIIRLKTL